MVPSTLKHKPVRCKFCGSKIPSEKEMIDIATKGPPTDDGGALLKRGRTHGIGAGLVCAGDHLRRRRFCGRLLQSG